MTLSALWHHLWTARLLLQTALLAWMIARNLYKDFPVFVLYTADVVLQTIIDKAMIRSPSISGAQYFVVYAIGGLVSAILSFAVLYEIFKRAFRDYPALSKLGGQLFRVTTVSLLLTGVWLAWLKPAAELRGLMSRLDLVDQTICVMQCGLVIVLFLLSRNIGVSLRSRTFGIAFGFGILASVGLAAMAIKPRIESSQYTQMMNLLTLTLMAAALCSVAVWTAYLVLPETVADLPVRPLPVHDMESWNQELRRLLR